MRERLEENPQDQQDKQSALIITSLLAGSDQNLTVYWQNRKFLFEFPGLAVYLIGSKGRAEFTEDERTKLFALSLKTFLPNNNQKISGYSFTKEGKVVTRSNKTVEERDSLTKALTASILLIGMSLPDKGIQRSLLIDSYQNLSNNRKVNLVDSFGRLLGQNNVTRTWIKENRLDADNGFDWDTELSQLLFFGIYAQETRKLFVPQEMDMLEYYSLETRSVMLNFALHYAENLTRSGSSAKLSGFIMQMEPMEMTEDIRKKLDLFKQKVLYARSGIRLD